MCALHSADGQDEKAAATSASDASDASDAIDAGLLPVADNEGNIWPLAPSCLPPPPSPPTPDFKMLVK